MKTIRIDDDVLRRAVSDLLEHVDYDVWKAYFVEGENDADHQEGEISEMIAVLYRALTATRPA